MGSGKVQSCLDSKEGALKADEEILIHNHDKLELFLIAQLDRITSGDISERLEATKSLKRLLAFGEGPAAMHNNGLN